MALKLIEWGRILFCIVMILVDIGTDVHAILGYWRNGVKYIDNAAKAILITLVFHNVVSMAYGVRNAWRLKNEGHLTVIMSSKKWVLLTVFLHITGLGPIAFCLEIIIQGR